MRRKGRKLRFEEMAKAIQATPALKGEGAKRFIELMVERENSPMANTHIFGIYIS